MLPREQRHGGTWCYSLLTRGGGGFWGVFPSVGHPRLVCPSWGSGTERRAVNSAAVLSLLSKKLGSKRQINLPSLLPALLRGTFREGGAGLCASDGR